MLWDACPCNAPGHSHNQTPHTHPDSRPSPSSRLRRADQFGAHRPCSATRERPHLSPHAPSRASSQPRAAVVPRGDGGRPGNGGRRPARRRLPLLAGGRGRHPAGAAVEADSHLATVRRRRRRLRRGRSHLGHFRGGGFGGGRLLLLLVVYQNAANRGDGGAGSREEGGALAQGVGSGDLDAARHGGARWCGARWGCHQQAERGSCDECQHPGE
mmetsp:Transcript_11116/g.32715  ORF Transcript_11116/g.32715 Transcript_11116/m.32715 type:complete len:214 (+) Transcript_11116:149-790(+)